MLESGIEDTVVNHAADDGWLVRKMCYIGRRGAPDRWFFKGGRVIIIEFKKPGEVPTPQQAREHKRLAKAGFPVHIIDNIKAGLALFA